MTEIQLAGRDEITMSYVYRLKFNLWLIVHCASPRDSIYIFDERVYLLFKPRSFSYKRLSMTDSFWMRDIEDRQFSLLLQPFVKQMVLLFCAVNFIFTLLNFPFSSYFCILLLHLFWPCNLRIIKQIQDSKNSEISFQNNKSLSKL